MLLKGKIAVITGGASPRGLGLAMARLFAEHGARVAILDLDAEKSREAAKSLKRRGHMGFKCDVTKKPQCERAMARILKRCGRVDVLVNNAGITSPQRLLEVTPESYSRVMDINMRGTLNMTQAVVPVMRAQRSGSIVNLSSVSAQRGGGIFGGSHYSASKAAILGYTKACARELGPDNVRVNAICPELYRHRHHRRVDDAGKAQGHHRLGAHGPGQATPSTSPAAPCSSPAISPPTSPAARSTSTAAAISTSRLSAGISCPVATATFV